MSWWVWVGVALLGGVGANARFLVNGLVGAHTRGSFPLPVLVINVSGSLLLGVFAGIPLEGNALILAGTATLGSYTTFSTWMLETRQLAADGSRGAAVLNVLISLALGIGAVALGRLIGGHV
jgi:fluoride exporter